MMIETDYKTGQPSASLPPSVARVTSISGKWLLKNCVFRQGSMSLTRKTSQSAIAGSISGVIVQMATDYIKLVRNIVTKLRIRSCKGVPYVRLDGTNIFIKDLRTKVYEPLEKLLRSIRNTPSTGRTISCNSPISIRQSKKLCLFFDMEQSRAFKDAYKGCRRLLHSEEPSFSSNDCGFPKMSQKCHGNIFMSLHLKKILEGYKLFGILKDFLVVNGINIEAMRS